MIKNLDFKPSWKPLQDKKGGQTGRSNMFGFPFDKPNDPNVFKPFGSEKKPNPGNITNSETDDLDELIMFDEALDDD